MLHFTTYHKFNVNGKIELIEADGVERACELAERKFGKEAKYIGIKIKC